MGRLQDGCELSGEGVVARQVEEVEVGGIAVSGGAEASGTFYTEVDEVGGIGDEVAVFIHHAHSDIAEVVAVGLQTRAVGDEFEVVGLACGADGGGQE